MTFGNAASVITNGELRLQDVRPALTADDGMLTSSDDSRLRHRVANRARRQAGPDCNTLPAMWGTMPLRHATAGLERSHDSVDEGDGPRHRPVRERHGAATRRPLRHGTTCCRSREDGRWAAGHVRSGESDPPTRRFDRRQNAYVTFGAAQARASTSRFESGPRDTAGIANQQWQRRVVAVQPSPRAWQKPGRPVEMNISSGSGSRTKCSSGIRNTDTD